MSLYKLKLTGFDPVRVRLEPTRDRYYHKLRRIHPAYSVEDLLAIRDAITQALKAYGEFD